MTHESSELVVTVRLARPLFIAAEPPTAAIAARIASQISQVLDDLGVDRRPVVRLEMGDDLDPARPIELRLDARRCRFPQTILAERCSYVSGSAVVPPGADPILLLVTGEDEEGVGRLGEVLAGVCGAAVSAQPELLLPATAEAAHHRVVELGMRAPDGDGSEDAGPRTDRDPAELLIAAQGSPTIDLHIEKDYLRTLSAAQGVEMFVFMRSQLFADLGLTLPQFRLRPDPSLRKNSFAFRINALLTDPRIGLSSGTVFVNDTAERLALMEVDAEPTTNPATGQPAALVSQEHQALLEAAALTTWDQFGFLILCLAAEIRRRAHVFMTSEVTEGQLSTLEVAYPALGRGIRTHSGPDELAAVLRQLLRDGIAVRNLRRIAELILRHETLQPPCDRATFVRRGLADATSAKVARGTSTVVTYLLSPEVEAAIAGWSADDDPADARDTVPDRVIAAVYAELDRLQPTALRPTILAADDVRPTLEAMVRQEFPRLVVISHADLLPRQNVQPVARLSWV